MLPPRPLVGGGARLKAMSAARRSSGLRFKHSAQIVRVGGGQVYDRQAGPGNSRPGLIIKPRYVALPSILLWSHKVCSYQVHVIVPTRIKASAQAEVGWVYGTTGKNIPQPSEHITCCA